MTPLLYRDHRVNVSDLAAGAAGLGDLVNAGDLVDATAIYAVSVGANPHELPRLLFTRQAWYDVAAWDEHNTAHQTVAGRIGKVLAAAEALDPSTGHPTPVRAGQRRRVWVARIPNARMASMAAATNVDLLELPDGHRTALLFCATYEP